jgi:two-component system NarL family sensor kinase
VLFAPERLKVGTGRAGGLTGWAAVRSTRGIVAWVGVRRDDTAHAQRRFLLHGASGILGLLAGLAIFLFPTAVVRRQATRLEEGRAVLRGQESERERIARDLHDGLGQGLVALRMAVEGGRTEDALAASDESMAELRRVVADLRPPDLQADGLRAALRACTERFEKASGLPVSFRAPDEIEVTEEVGTALLRCLQESLGNAGRHSGASEIGVRLTGGDGRVVLEVEDDGKGFESAVADAGLRTVRERCDFLGGHVDVRRVETGGSAVRIELPTA